MLIASSLNPFPTPMPTKVTWSWVEAFDKLGFEDGNGSVMTDVVEAVLWDAGYFVTAAPWGRDYILIAEGQRR